ncbi:MAG: cobalt-precorrin-5B (C(1))-methyltransferase [Pseudomonadota bacterium]
MSDEKTSKRDATALRRGWTTGACATAATKAAYQALLTGTFPDPVEIRLPKGETVGFALAVEALGDGWARAGVVKDAGDDPDVTHGATILATVRQAGPGSGTLFVAGEGVGTVTRPGLPIPPGEPAINPVPRQMIRAALEEVAAACGATADVEVTIAVPEGRALAEKTWNPRLGILGGLSILGTTGIVRPFSCSAWIASIHRGIDVAVANDLPHVIGSTGSTSEKAARGLFPVQDIALLDMGDFAGGLLKYLRQHPVPRLTIAGGFAKLTKLAQGALDLHSGRSQVDFDRLAGLAGDLGASSDLAESIRSANTANQVLHLCVDREIALADLIARKARDEALSVLRGADVDVDVLIVDRTGQIVAHAPVGGGRHG